MCWPEDEVHAGKQAAAVNELLTWSERQEVTGFGRNKWTSENESGLIQ
jgi:hypothetical protein